MIVIELFIVVNKKPDMQSQTNIHNVFLFTTINNSITIIEMNDDLY